MAKKELTKERFMTLLYETWFRDKGIPLKNLTLHFPDGDVEIYRDGKLIADLDKGHTVQLPQGHTAHGL